MPTAWLKSNAMGGTVTDWGRTMNDWYRLCQESEERSMARRVNRWKRTRERIAGAVLVIVCVLAAIKW